MQRMLFLLILFWNCYIASITAGELSPDIQHIVDRHQLVIAVYSKDIPPFFFKNQQGILTGYDIELARELARRLGVTAVFNRQATTSDQVIELVASGKADIGISRISRTLPRALKVNFSQPYLRLPQALLVNRLADAHLGWEGKVAEELKNHTKNIRLGVQANSAYVFYARSYYPHVILVSYSDIKQAMGDLKAGKLFAIFFNQMEMEDWLVENPEADLYFQLVPINGIDDGIAIAIPWQSGHLLRWINLYLDVIKKDGTADRWLKTYFKKMSNVTLLNTVIRSE